MASGLPRRSALRAASGSAPRNDREGAWVRAALRGCQHPLFFKRMVGFCLPKGDKTLPPNDVIARLASEAGERLNMHAT